MKAVVLIFILLTGYWLGYTRHGSPPRIPAQCGSDTGGQAMNGKTLLLNAENSQPASKRIQFTSKTIITKINLIGLILSLTFEPKGWSR